jgi:5-methylcytosine-specific restriction endonuclease McrA
MTTFSSREKTHRAVLPQRRALESAEADTPGSRDETVCGLPATALGAGTEHERGEILLDGTRPAGRHPDPAPAGKGVAREGHPTVFVLDRHHQPLMPCTPARARILLKRGRAVVHRHTPFAIRLKDRTAAISDVSGVEIGIDPGSRTTGIAAFRTVTTPAGEARYGLFSLELNHRGGQIRDRLTTRASLRRARRARKLRYRSPRFHNRSRREGWLPPSLQHRVDTTASWVDRLTRWAPVRAVHVERVTFDTHAMTAGRPLSGAEYQCGTLHGMEVREYLLTKWRRTCAYCGATDVPLNIDHIHPRSQGGSDRITNLTLACVPCNQAKSNQPVEDFLKSKPALLARILAQAKTPLRSAAAMNATRNALVRTLGCIHPDIRSSSGGRTKWNRQLTHPRAILWTPCASGPLIPSAAIPRPSSLSPRPAVVPTLALSRTGTDFHGSSAPAPSGTSATPPATWFGQTFSMARSGEFTSAASPSEHPDASTSGRTTAWFRASIIATSVSSNAQTDMRTPPILKSLMFDLLLNAEQPPALKVDRSTGPGAECLSGVHQ